MRGEIKAREFARVVQALLDVYGPRYDEDGAMLVSVRVIRPKELKIGV